MVKVLCIVQARLTSSRLPDKVLQKLGYTNLSLLEHLYFRLQQSKKIDQIVFAIPNTPLNDLLAEFLDNQNISYSRGDENNVLKRFYECTKKYSSQLIVRSTCDNPCVDWRVADNLIEAIGNNDYVSGIGGPIGTSLEVFTTNALKKAFIEAKDDVSKEHVTPYIYRNPELFKTDKIHYYLKLKGSFRLTVDTKEDMKLINIIYENLYKGFPIANVDIYKFLDDNPELLEINNEIKQNKI
jgi:spore coat polysaccharide biosynthesis protein SpsF